MTTNKQAVPLCTRCKDRPRQPVRSRTTGEWYFWSYCQQCEKERKQVKKEVA